MRPPRFIEILKSEADRLVTKRGEFLASFSEADLNYLVERWAMKVGFCKAGDMKWGIYLASKRVMRKTSNWGGYLCPPACLMTPDTRDLAAFGYKQVLDRTLGSFSSFAAGFSYISILTGVFQMFYVGYGAGGPAFYWTWPMVFLGQITVALCFAELAAHYPLVGRNLPVVAVDRLARSRLDGGLGVPVRLGHQPGRGRAGPAGDSAADCAGVSVDR